MRCWYTRWKMSSAIDDAIDPGGGAALERIAARGHAARCARCAAYARSLGALDRRLAREAAAAPAPVVAAPARAVRWPLLAGGAAVAAAAGAVLLLRGSGPVEVAEERAPVADTVIVPPAPPAPAPLAPAVQRTAVRVSDAVGAPFQAEIRALLADGRRGVGAVLASSGLL